MRRLGQWLMGIGGAVGIAVGVAILAHVGWAAAPWIVNVALAKLGVVASLGLMAGGAASIRIASRREQRKELSGVRGQ